MWLQNKLKSEFRCLKTLLTTPPKSIMDKLYGIIGNLHCKLPGLKRQRSTVFFLILWCKCFLIRFWLDAHLFDSTMTF